MERLAENSSSQKMDFYGFGVDFRCPMEQFFLIAALGTGLEIDGFDISFMEVGCF